MNHAHLDHIDRLDDAYDHGRRVLPIPDGLASDISRRFVIECLDGSDEPAVNLLARCTVAAVLDEPFATYHDPGDARFQVLTQLTGGLGFFPATPYAQAVKAAWSKN